MEWDRNGTDGRTCRIETCVWFGLLGPQRDNLLAQPLYAWEVIL
jgi:hypothetical protein